MANALPSKSRKCAQLTGSTSNCVDGKTDFKQLNKNKQNRCNTQQKVSPIKTTASFTIWK